LRAAGFDVSVYLAHRESPSFSRAEAAGFAPLVITELPARLAADTGPVALVVAATPDDIIGTLYRELVANVARPLTFILLHGYAVYAGQLKDLAPGHELALLAPKAIGPKLAAAAREAGQGTHQLVAGFHASEARRPQLIALARSLGFAPENLVPATFEQEAVGDLISEQALLCGGVFNLIEWTYEAMRSAGIPERLIREECLTELELIAGLVRAHGPAVTFGKISQAAQCGTLAMRDRLEAAGVPQAIARQAEDVVSRRFVAAMNDPEWRNRARELKARLAKLEGSSA
jgi:ketol-acid reductoisomerase